MDARTLGKLKKDLTSFLDEVAGTLGNPRRRRWCESYLRGVLLDGHRKSVEPMAARLKVIEQGEHDYEQGLQQFLNQSPWDEQAVLDGLQSWIARQFGTAGVLIIDDTGFPKQGKHSVGVARQYHKLSAGKEPRAACWLLAEWPEGDAHPAKYFFSNLPPKTSLKRLVATAKSRWWVEHSYRELKDELGLDHFEGRSWRGWNHHVVLVLMAYAFLQDVRRRRVKKVASP